MLNQKAIQGQADYARKLNAGEFDQSPAFTSGQVDHNGQVRSLDRGRSALLVACGGPEVKQTKTLKLSGEKIVIPMDADGEAIIADLEAVEASNESNTVTGPLDLTSDIIAYEEGELTDEETVAMFQRLVDTGLAWQLQGHYGRTANAMIEQGMITRPVHFRHNRR